MTVESAAAYLGFHAQTIRRLIHAGELRAAPVGRSIRLDREDLDQMMLRRKRLFSPYRKGTKPWVSARHAANRAA